MICLACNRYSPNMTKRLPSILVAFGAVFGWTVTANAGIIAYSDFDGSKFGTVDLNTGQATVIASLSTSLTGLGVANGVLFGAQSGGTTVYTINPNTGALTALGNSSLAGPGFTAFGSTNGGLFAFDGNNLYSINPTSAAATLIAPVSPEDCCLSNGGDSLYFGSPAGYLHQVNTSTGGTTLIGSTGGAAVGGLLFDAGTFYTMIGNPPSSIWTADPITFARTFDASASPYQLLSLAVLPASTAPEPASFSLFAVGVLAALMVWFAKWVNLALFRIAKATALPE